jgi:hypothetical protein
MSKMGNWVLQMQEDAAHMSREDFVDVYGTANLAVWDEVNGYGFDRELVEEGFHGS